MVKWVSRAVSREKKMVKLGKWYVGIAQEIDIVVVGNNLYRVECLIHYCPTN